MKLPLEIRNMIYELLLVSPNGKIAFGDHLIPIKYNDYTGEWRMRDTELPTINLLRVSKAVYEEALRVMLNKNDLVLVGGEDDEQTYSLPERFISYIKTVEVHFHAGESLWSRYHQHVIEQCTKAIAQEAEIDASVSFQEDGTVSRTVREVTSHGVQRRMLEESWEYRMRGTVRLRADTWILDVTYCYCAHHCCRLAHDALGVFSNYLMSYNLNHYDHYLRDTPRFLILGLEKWEEDYAWKCINEAYFIPVDDTRLRNGERIYDVLSKGTAMPEYLSD